MLSTSSNETTKYAHSFEIGVGGKVDIVRYDTDEADEVSLYDRVKEARPEFVFYIGSAWGRQPSLMTLARINSRIAPMVHICSDAADDPWWPLLREYNDKACFSLQVAIDGNDNWPGAERGLTLLTPVDPANFQTRLAHATRPVACGYGGNPGSLGGARREILWETMTHNLLTVRMRDGAPETYTDYCGFILHSRMSLNIAFSGTEARLQVKGRVIESGLAACCLLEVAGSPTSRWFAPDLEYLEYASVAQLRGYIKELGPEETERRGERLRAKVLAEHTPTIFWAKVLDRVGLRKAA